MLQEYDNSNCKSQFSITSAPKDYVGDLARTYSTIKLTCEYAGKSFFNKYEKIDEVDKTLNDTEELDESESNSCNSTNISSQTTYTGNMTGRKNFSKQFKNLTDQLCNIIQNDEDLYYIMYTDKYISGAQLPKLYKYLAYVYHPDKKNCEDNTLFKCPIQLSRPILNISKMSVQDLNDEFAKICNAFNILSNYDMRRIYDSTLIFDDYLPTFINSEEFFTVVPKMFGKESFWCTQFPIPPFPSKVATSTEVEKFYSYWRNFKTRRDYTFIALEDVYSDMDKYYRKQVEKEKWKIISKLEKEENNRLQDFVTLCMSIDPRLAANTNSSNKVNNKINPLEKIKLKRKKDAQIKEAKDMIKANFRKYVKLPEYNIDYVKVDDMLAKWLAKVNDERILKLWINIKAEAKKYIAPNKILGNRIVKIVKDQIENNS